MTKFLSDEKARADIASLTQLQNVWTPRNYQKKFGICIEDCSNTTGWMANTPYVSVPTVSDEHLFEQRSLKFTVGLSGWRGIGVPVNYDFTNVTKIGIAVKIPEEHSFDSVKIRFTTDSSKGTTLWNDWTKYFWCSLGETSVKLHSGWNFIILNKNNFTNVGGETWEVFKALNMEFEVPAKKFNSSWGVSSVDNTPVDFYLGGIYLNPEYDTPRLIIEFDDSLPTAYTNGFSYARKKGVRCTMNVCRNHVSDIVPTYDTPEHHDIMYNAGWDICAHSTTHDNEWAMTESQIYTEWETILRWLLDRGYTRSAYFGAYPQARYNTTIMNVVKSLGFKFMRGGKIKLIDHITPDEMLCFPTYEIKGATTLNTVKGWIDAAIAKGSSLCIFTHGIVSENPDEYSTTITNWRAFIDYVVEKRDSGLLLPVTKSEFYAGLSDKTISVPDVISSYV